MKNYKCYFTDYLYEHIDTIIFRVLVSYIYTIIDPFICIGYLCFLQDKLSKHDKSVGGEKFNYLYGVGIP